MNIKKINFVTQFFPRTNFIASTVDQAREKYLKFNFNFGSSVVFPKVSKSGTKFMKRKFSMKASEGITIIMNKKKQNHLYINKIDLPTNIDASHRSTLTVVYISTYISSRGYTVTQVLFLYFVCLCSITLSTADFKRRKKRQTVDALEITQLAI